jgi:hypothetical protein
MLDPHLETVRFVLFALAIGVVIFGGTTLAYFLDQRRKDSSNHVPAQPLHEQSKVTRTGGNMEAQSDKAA